ncbi:EamA family transporter RarD [Croceicoccus bisphenolivorans]|uniref:EamA family transporter RarD n=1 Tax=Croceicoccus bisphenolivorans TaxID=1783232 RepID=UPI0008344BAF|nr:EamA family transporter RarD [Croceicoccus bisphenolivorans]
MNRKSDPQSRSGGLPYALGAYFMWGLIPLYIVQLNGVDPFRLVAWRVVWTIPICVAVLAVTGEFGKMKAALTNRTALGLLATSAALISLNWTVYVAAVQAGAFYAASLGYYINPLINVVIGTVFLGERLSRLQWLAVAVAALGIGILAFAAAATLYISLTLALSFGFYGLVRKKVHVDALPGLTVEVLLIAPIACAGLWLIPVTTRDFTSDASTALLLVGAGAITGVPLLLFATAARRMTYSALGFTQFMAPTMVFLCGLLIFREELKQAQLACFILIWFAVALFCADIMRRGRRTPPSARI